jgi:hypothetical protein
VIPEETTSDRTAGSVEIPQYTALRVLAVWAAAALPMAALSWLVAPALERMNGVFGRADRAANGVLFAGYHLHVPWAIPTVLLDTFLLSYPMKRYRSAWIGSPSTAARVCSSSCSCSRSSSENRAERRRARAPTSV